MELPQLSIDNFAALCLVILTPWLYRTFRPFSTDPWKQTRLEQIISTLLLAHTLFMLHALLVSPPQNIFKALGLGLGAAPEHLRAKIVDAYGGDENVPQHMTLLLKRLGLADLRLFYVRFGHDVLTTCSYCHSFGDFALYEFPGPLLEYIREIAFAGILTLPSTPTTRYRPLALGALLGALLTEAYWTLTVESRLPTTASPNVEVTMWHDLFVQMRHALFLILPLVVTILPSLGLHRLPIIGPLFPVPLHEQRAGLPPAQFQMQGQNITLPPGSTLQSASTLALQTLSHLVPTLHLFKYANGAVMRMQAENSTDAASSEKKAAKAPHERAAQWWMDEAKEGRVVREDGGVRGILKSAGLSIEPEVKEGDTVVQPEGPLLLSAKMAIKFLKEQGAVASGLWTQ